MSWIDDSGRHEGRAVSVFGDGAYGASLHRGRVMLLGADGRLIPDPGDPEGFLSRPVSQVIGWRSACTCTAGRDVDHPELIAGETLWLRVWTPEEEDIDARLVYAGGPQSEDPADVADRPDIEGLMYAEWRRHAAPEIFVQAVRGAHRAVKDAEAALDEAVRTARAENVPWSAIGAAAGISRQAAQKRWGRDSSTYPALPREEASPLL